MNFEEYTTKQLKTILRSIKRQEIKVKNKLHIEEDIDIDEAFRMRNTKKGKLYPEQLVGICIMKEKIENEIEDREDSD